MTLFRFGDFEIDSNSRVLTRSGSQLDIGRRATDLLIYLIENRPRAVDSSELMAKVWKANAISSSAIPTCVMTIRRALEQDPSNPRIVCTIRGQGYAFRACVEKPRSADLFSEDLAGRFAFSGRNDELNQLLVDNERSVAESRFVMSVIVGSAGMGKTRLAQEFVAKISSSSRTYVSRCPEIDGCPPYFPWRNLAEQLIQDLRSRGSQSTASLESKLDRLAAPPTFATPNAGRENLFHFWTEAFKEASIESPLSIVVDDIHRADEDSVDLAHWLCCQLQTSRIHLILLFRQPNAPLRIERSLAKLSSLEESRVISLEPLTEEDIFSAVAHDTASPAEVSRIIIERTAGNPFFIQALHQLIPNGSTTEDLLDITNRLPLSSPNIIDRILGNLPGMTQRCLETASVAGREFDIATAASAARTTPAEFLADLAPAIRAGIIQDATDGPRRARFTHSILRDALYSSIDPETRRKHHLGFANALQQRPSASTGGSALRVFCHLEQSLPLGSEIDVIRFGLTAGEQLLGEHAFIEAKSVLSRASSVACTYTQDHAQLRCDILIALSKAQLYTNDRPASRATLLSAAAIARDHSLPETLGRCAIQLAPDFLTIEYRPADSQLIAILNEALSLTEREDYELRALLLARLSMAMSWSGDPSRGEPLATLAQAAAAKAWNSGCAPSAAAAAVDSLPGPKNVSKRLGALRQLRTLVFQSNQPTDTLNYYVRDIAALLEAGRITSFDSRVEELSAYLDDARLPQYAWYPIAYRAMRALMQGDLDLGNRLGEEFASVGQLTPDANVSASRACQACLFALEANLSSQALEIATSFVRENSERRSWAAGRALLLQSSGRSEEAFEVFAGFSDQAICNLACEPGGGAGVAFLSEIAASAGYSPRLELLYDICTSLAGTSATLGSGMGYFGVFDRYCGILARALGRPDTARQHLLAAAKVEKERRAYLAAMHCDLDLAALEISESRIERAAILLDSTRKAASTRHVPRVSARITTLSMQISGRS